MENRISDLLDCLEDAGQDLKPRSGNAARVRAKTFAKLHEAENVVSVRRRARPWAALIAAAAAVMLLCGSAFAAWKLGAFHFTEEFGPAGEVLDAHAQSYEPEDSTAVPASFGYASWVKGQLGDYNLTLLRLEADNSSLRATVDVSAAREGVPALRDSGLRLVFADYETFSTLPREMEGYKDRVELSAALPERLDPDAEVAFALSGPGSGTQRVSFRLDALDQAWQEMVNAERQHFASSAETKDYRFSLRSLTASATTVYGVLDVEALSEYGRTHLDQVPEIAVTNHTHPVSGSILDPRLLEEGEGQRRYLVGFVGERPLNEAGDAIRFELLQLFEEGDMSGHPYYLFDVKLENLVPDAVTATEPQGSPEGSISWGFLSVDTMGLSVEGSGKVLDGSSPKVELVFRDGTRETVVDNTWKHGTPRSAHDAMLRSYGGEGREDGVDLAHLSLVFSTPLDVSQLAAVVVDGQSFSVNP